MSKNYWNGFFITKLWHYTLQFVIIWLREHKTWPLGRSWRLTGPTCNCRLWSHYLEPDCQQQKGGHCVIFSSFNNVICFTGGQITKAISLFYKFPDLVPRTKGFSSTNFHSKSCSPATDVLFTLWTRLRAHSCLAVIAYEMTIDTNVDPSVSLKLLQAHLQKILKSLQEK